MLALNSLFLLFLMSLIIYTCNFLSSTFKPASVIVYIICLSLNVDFTDKAVVHSFPTWPQNRSIRAASQTRRKGLSQADHKRHGKQQ